MTRKRIDDNQAAKVADEIVNYMFTNGAREKAQRLVLELEDGSNGGGWCRGAVKSMIVSKLKALEVIGIETKCTRPLPHMELDISDDSVV